MGWRWRWVRVVAAAAGAIGLVCIASRAAHATMPRLPLEAVLHLEPDALVWSLTAHEDVALRRSDWTVLPATAAFVPPFAALELHAGETRSGRVPLPQRTTAWVAVRLQVATPMGVLELGAAARARQPGASRPVHVVAKPGAATPGTVTATIQYEDRLLGTAGYTGGVQRLALRYVEAALVDTATGSIRTRATVDRDGRLQLETAGAAGGIVRLRLWATTGNDPRYDLAVLDPPTSGPDPLRRARPHHIDTEPFALLPGGTDLGTLVLRDPDGFGSLQAFHILDVAIDAWDALRSGAIVGVVPQAADSLRLLWSQTLRSRSTAYGNGYIELASPASGDTDGWSDALILHEIGHHVARRFLRDTSSGGLHLLGDVEQDLQLAWSEGLATAFACAVRDWRARTRRNADGGPADRDPALFINVGLPPPDGVAGGLQYVWDVEAATLGAVQMPRDGTGSETSVAGALWDTMDAAPDDDDPLPGPAARTGAVLRAMRERPEPHVTFENFWHHWQLAMEPAERAALDAILADFRIELFPDAAEPDEGANVPRAVPTMPHEASGGIVISEVVGGARIAVELANRSLEPRDLGGWQLLARNNTSSGNPALTYTIPAGFVLGPGARVVVRRGRRRDDTARDLYADLWTVPWFPGFEGALMLRDAQANGVDFVRWSARDGTASTTPPPPGTGWSEERTGADFGASLARRSDQIDTDRGSDWTTGAPTLGAPNDVPALHRTFFPAGDRDELTWRAPAAGVYTLALRRLRSGAVPVIEMRGMDGGQAGGEMVPGTNGEARLSVAAQAGETFTVTLTHAGSVTQSGAYDISLWSEPDLQLALPPQAVRAAVDVDGASGRVHLQWWNGAHYDSIQVRSGSDIHRLPGAARAWEIELPVGRHALQIRGFVRGAIIAAPPLLVAVEAWPDRLATGFDELSAADWERSGDWGLDTAPGRDGMALVTRPGGPYGDDTEGVVRWRSAVRATAMTTLEFDHICSVRPEDRAALEISDDWGATWHELGRWDWNAHDGDGEAPNWRDGRADAADWVHERLSLAAWDGRPVQIRFAFASDFRGSSAGWFVDNLSITPGTAPPPVPFSIRLDPNAPNPFNPGTRIRFALSHPANVRLRIFDARGRIVRQLVDAPLDAGAHDVLWDGRDERGRDVVSGIYFDELRAGDQVRSRKLVLVR